MAELQRILSETNAVEGFNMKPDMVSLYNRLIAQPGPACLFALLAPLITIIRNQRAILEAVNRGAPGPAVSFIFKEKNMPPAIFTIGDNQFIDLTVGAVDSLGNPTSDPNALSATSSDPTIATATMLDASTVRVQSAKGPLGSVQVTVTDGTITGSCQVNVQAGAVASFAFSGGTPQDIPAS